MFSSLRCLERTTGSVRFASLARLSIIGGYVAIALILAAVAPECAGQSPKIGEPTEPGMHTIILSPGHAKPPAFLYAATAQAKVRVGANTVEQKIQLNLRIVQGRGDTISLGLNGEGDVVDVQGESIAAWSVRTAGKQRFLDLQLKVVSSQPNESQPNENQPQESQANDSQTSATVLTTEPPASDLSAIVSIRSRHNQLPARIALAHLTPGKALGFDSQVQIETIQGVTGKVMQADGFAPLVATDSIDRLQTATGGRLVLNVDRSSAFPADIVLSETKLTGELHSSGKSIHFEFRGVANVNTDSTRLRILTGNVAISQLPTDSDYQLELIHTATGPAYDVVFRKSGRVNLALDFIAAVKTDSANWQGIDFIVAASAVVPLSLRGLEKEVEFTRDQNAIIPMLSDGQWQGFLPATGRVNMRWRNQRVTTEGKSFFTTSSIVEASVGPGLLRHEHRITYQMLQGQLQSLSLRLIGPGEILSVETANMVSWKVTGEGNQRSLEIALNQPLSSKSELTVRSQTPLGDFPVQVEGLSIQPQESIRNSGHLRVSNSGSVSVEPTSLRGLTQLAPDQFPGQSIDSRQLFVYRFPSSDYSLSIKADRVRPEISVTQLVIYHLSESARVITADLELDIREAAIRQFNIGVPEEYSIVSVTGASVADHMSSTESNEGVRNLKILFSQDILGRQLVSLRLEKNEVAATGQWKLPRLVFPEADAVRGDIGVTAAAGYRATSATTELLVDKPLSYFPRPVPNLQQAFRIREPAWSATMQIEQLERSVQADSFHLISLSQGVVYGSALVNYTVAGAPVTEWRLNVPSALGNLSVDGHDIRTWRREGDVLIVTLHRAIVGAYTMLITYEEKPNVADGSFQAGVIAPLDVQGDRGYIEVVSPLQVEMDTLLASNQLLVLDPLELPAEFRLLSTAPSLGTWQYTQRPFELRLKVNWFDPGTTTPQVVEFSEANSRVSQDGELVTDVLYYIKSRGERTLKLRLPGEPVRLWAVSVDGRPVTARRAGDDTLIPLPAATDPNSPVEVSLRLGKPAKDERHATLELPIVFAPVLKTQWKLQADENHTLLSSGGSVEPTTPVHWPNGFDWLATRGIVPLAILAVLTAAVAGAISLPIRLVGWTVAILVAAFIGWFAWQNMEPVAPLQLDLPVLASGESIRLEVSNIPTWRAFIYWPGVALSLLGLVLVLIAVRARQATWLVRCLGIAAIAIGALLQYQGAPYFFGLAALALTLFQWLPDALKWREILGNRWSATSTAPVDSSSSEPPPGTIITAPTWLLLLSSLCAGLSSTSVIADEPATALKLNHTRAEATAPKRTGNDDLQKDDLLKSASSLIQTWTVTSRDKRLMVSADIKLSGRSGDRFLLLRAPAVLTEFRGTGLLLTKEELPGVGLAYVVTIPSTTSDSADKAPAPSDQAEDGNDGKQSIAELSASFQYQLEAIQPAEGIAVLTGPAALERITLEYDEPSWEVACDAAARIDVAKEKQATDRARATLLLGPGPAKIFLLPQTRDLSSEATQFFVEGAHLYTSGPGAIDGTHRLKVRTSQGRLQALIAIIPNGLTVSAVDGPVSAWQFDVDKGRLEIQIAPKTASEFVVTVQTQRSLSALPAQVELMPLRVEGVVSEVGLVALAFGSEAQPENVQSEKFSQVNLGDFDASLLANSQATLHRVYRYGMEAGKLSLEVSPVAPEVRVVSKQVLSFGDERVVLGVNFIAEISRTGLFQLSFPLPAGLEVESLTGDALDHWSELTDGGQRQIVMHLKGKTIGSQKFAVTLAGITPSDVTEWDVPRLEMNESTRQTGELVVQPITGIRLRTITRQNISEADPRTLGAREQGALGFRLLQQDWSLRLGIEKLDAWVTGQVLHDVTLREGQTRATLLADFTIQNAAVRTLLVRLPTMSEDEVKSLRASGELVSDFVRSNPDGNAWELRLKRRVIGPLKVQIEYERRGQREVGNELLNLFEFPDARQLGYYFAVRAGGRLEIEVDRLTQGWQRYDWNTVPQQLRDAGDRHAPVLTLRAISPPAPLSVRVIRHSLADALKLRVASGTLTTILSPTGDQLTAVDVNMEVIQRSSLSVQLPAGGELFSIFVNGESVHSIRQKSNNNVWQFYILPGIDDRTAQVRFVYSLKGDSLHKLDLVSPQMNVPLENIQWDVVAPSGFELSDSDGNLELVGYASRSTYDRQAYMSSMQGKRQAQAQQAASLLEQANQLLQSGEQSKAQWALNNVANRNALDAASNEDARVQLENLQTQQAIVGLNTRRQRLMLDRNRVDPSIVDNEQLRQAAAINPVLQREQTNYLPQELTQLLAGNSQEDNATLGQIAGRLVQHQRAIEPVPQAIVISLPEDGNVYSFRRSVQVTENAPLALQLQFHSQFKLRAWQVAILTCLVALLTTGLAWRRA